jgi:DNA-directed RNA polymerase specialized sigma24 family protein
LPRRPDDIHLLARLRHPDSAQDWLEAWETLIREHSGRVYGLALRMLRHRQDAEDATQVVWERVLSALESLPRRGGAQHVAVPHHDERLPDKARQP